MNKNNLTEDEINEYLHGKCIQWLEENYSDKYKIAIITTSKYDEDFDGELETLVHVTLYTENDTFIDVRGEIDYETMIGEFWSENDFNLYIKEDLSSMKKFFRLIKS